MSELPNEMNLDAEEFFKIDVNRFPKKKLNFNEKHISKMILLNSLVESIVERRESQGKSPTEDEIQQIDEKVNASKYANMDTTEILEDFTTENIDLNVACRMGAKGMVRKLKKEHKRTDEYSNTQMNVLANSIEYDMKSNATHLNLRDKENAKRLYQCATAFGDELRKMGDKEEPTKKSIVKQKPSKPQEPKKKRNLRLV